MLKRPVDGRSDLYSLGVVLFECLTGRLPFEATDVGELLRMRLTAAVPDLTTLVADVHPVLAAVVTRLLAKDPDDRYPEAAALLTALRGCPGGAGSTPPSAPRRPLAGRAAERGELVALRHRTRDGQGGVARISGPAGSGRTRLAAEVADAAVAEGRCPVLRAAAHPDDTLPLASLRAAVDGCLEDLRSRSAEARALAERDVREAALIAGPAPMALLSARIGELLGGGAPAGGAESGEHLVTAVATFLGELAIRSPAMMLVLADAHWLDTGSRQVLDKLAVDRERVPLLVVLAELLERDRVRLQRAQAVVRLRRLDPQPASRVVDHDLPAHGQCALSQFQVAAAQAA